MIKQKLAIFDIDGTLARSWLFSEVLLVLLQENLLPPEVKDKFDFSEHKHNWRIRKSEDSFNNYNNHMITTFRQYASYIKVADFESACRSAVERIADFYYVYSFGLAKKLQREGYFILLISGSFDYAVKLFAEHHGLDYGIGSEFIAKKDYLTGELKRITYENKDQILLDWLDQRQFTLENSYGVGDTVGDSELLKIVDNPIAFNPNYELSKLAIANQWPMVIERKNLITRLQSDADGKLTAEII